MSLVEDIYITQDGKVVGILTNPFQGKVEAAKSLFGVLPDEANIEEVRAERMKSNGSIELCPEKG